MADTQITRLKSRLALACSLASLPTHAQIVQRLPDLAP